ncbi:hypothetical protein QVD17_17039 [Tagetes erecta]|uniref:Uncharacterized protein n=1 Tax=Tagetes erecta TaxID=13708 RepID=A0AAD8KRK3_TARER|nr:hypothetical protein QVD17_17039 [Tagetes erecta]
MDRPFFRMDTPKKTSWKAFLLAREKCSPEKEAKSMQSSLYQQNRIRDFDSFVDEAAPGFELGKKDLQSPALPLGHAAKMIYNRIKISLFGLDY